MTKKDRISQLEQRVRQLEHETTLLKLRGIQKEIVPYPVPTYPKYPYYPNTPWIDPYTHITWCSNNTLNFPKEVTA